MNETTHIPVLSKEVIRLLHPAAGQTYFDGTAGYGGHAGMVHDKMRLTGRLILVDRDGDAVRALQARFPGAEVHHDTYLNAAARLVAAGERVDMVLLDLGVSSPQLDLPERGFSFNADGPLDMRMDQTTGRTAADIVNTVRERELADLIYTYGEDRKSRRIARAIVGRRPLTTTGQLAAVAAQAVGYHEKIHPATRTFQALRIAVNDELGQLNRALPILVQLLQPGGRLAVISFHSLEDRIVKDFFRTESRAGGLQILTKKPIPGTDDAFNPRARSAKLRAAVKLKPKPKEMA